MRFLLFAYLLVSTTAQATETYSYICMPSDQSRTFEITLTDKELTIIGSPNRAAVYTNEGLNEQGGIYFKNTYRYQLDAQKSKNLWRLKYEELTYFVSPELLKGGKPLVVGRLGKFSDIRGFRFVGGYISTQGDKDTHFRCSVKPSL